MVSVSDATNSATWVTVESGPIAAKGADAPGTTTLPVPWITPSDTNQVVGTVFSATSDGWTPAASSYEFRWFRCGIGGSQAAT